jgi:LCP family protein required for cell wall assembly
MKRQFVPIGAFKKKQVERNAEANARAALSPQGTTAQFLDSPPQSGNMQHRQSPAHSGQLPFLPWQPPIPPQEHHGSAPASFQRPSQPLAPPSRPSTALPPLPMPAKRYREQPTPFMQQSVRGPHKLRPQRKPRFPIWTRVAVAMLIVLLVLVGSGAYYYYANFASILGTSTGQNINRLQGDNGSAVPNNRINILLLGSDTDIKFTNSDGTHSYLAQTDIVVTIDPNTKSVGMLSIPRDTVLKAANNQGFMKLDQVYQRGGVALSLATIHQDFGIYIDHYAWVGLDGFIKVIDTVGGVDVDVLHPVTDDLYPDDTGTNKSSTDTGYKRLYIPPGPQHLNGAYALEYVRSRHSDLNGDFGRSARQQQVLNQLKTKLNNPGIFGQLPTLARDLNGYVKTDMNIPDILTWVNFARSIDSSKINRVVLDTHYSRTVDQYVIPGEESYGSQSVVFLNCNAVQPLMASMFALGDTAKCDTGVTTDGTLTTNSYSSPVAMTTATAVTTASTVPTSMDIGNLWQTISQIENPGDDLFGVRSLLDLMFLVVFESPAEVP